MPRNRRQESERDSTVCVGTTAGPIKGRCRRSEGANRQRANGCVRGYALPQAPTGLAGGIQRVLYTDSPAL